jgi:hypothetical protein
MSADVAGPRATSANETDVAGFGAVGAVVAGHGATGVEEAENVVTGGCSTESSSDGEMINGEMSNGEVADGEVAKDVLTDGEEISGEVIKLTVEMVTGQEVRTVLKETAAGNLEISREDHDGSLTFGKPVTFENIKKQAESIDFRGTTSNGGQFDRGGVKIPEATTNLWVKSWRSSKGLAVLRVMAHHGSWDLSYQMQRRRKMIKRRSV